jgi:hypothetical protein
MKNWDKILDDFARKCKGGAPDMTNPRHLALLRESLIKFGWKENATNEFVGNLREGTKHGEYLKSLPEQPWGKKTKANPTGGVKVSTALGWRNYKGDGVYQIPGYKLALQFLAGQEDPRAKEVLASHGVSADEDEAVESTPEEKALEDRMERSKEHMPELSEIQQKKETEKSEEIEQKRKDRDKVLTSDERKGEAGRIVDLTDKEMNSRDKSVLLASLVEPDNPIESGLEVIAEVSTGMDNKKDLPAGTPESTYAEKRGAERAGTIEQDVDDVAKAKGYRKGTDGKYYKIDPNAMAPVFLQPLVELTDQEIEAALVEKECEDPSELAKKLCGSKKGRDWIGVSIRTARAQRKSLEDNAEEYDCDVPVEFWEPSGGVSDERTQTVLREMCDVEIDKANEDIKKYCDSKPPNKKKCDRANRQLEHYEFTKKWLDNPDTDSYVFYKTKDGFMGVKHISNKKGFKDPALNTSIRQRGEQTKAMVEKMKSKEERGLTDDEAKDIIETIETKTDEAIDAVKKGDESISKGTQDQSSAARDENNARIEELVKRQKEGEELSPEEEQELLDRLNRRSKGQKKAEVAEQKKKENNTKIADNDEKVKEHKSTFDEQFPGPDGEEIGGLQKGKDLNNKYSGSNYVPEKWYYYEHKESQWKSVTPPKGNLPSAGERPKKPKGVEKGSKEYEQWEKDMAEYEARKEASKLIGETNDLAEENAALQSIQDNVEGITTNNDELTECLMNDEGGLPGRSMKDGGDYAKKVLDEAGLDPYLKAAGWEGSRKELQKKIAELREKCKKQEKHLEKEREAIDGGYDVLNSIEDKNSEQYQKAKKALDKGAKENKKLERQVKRCVQELRKHIKIVADAVALCSASGSQGPDIGKLVTKLSEKATQVKSTHNAFPEVGSLDDPPPGQGAAAEAIKKCMAGKKKDGTKWVEDPAGPGDFEGCKEKYIRDRYNITSDAEYDALINPSAGMDPITGGDDPTKSVWKQYTGSMAKGHTILVEGLLDKDQEYWDNHPDQAEEAGLKNENGKWVDNPDDKNEDGSDKTPENGPVAEAYIRTFMDQMHWEQYIMGEAPRKSQNIDGKEVSPEDYYECLNGLAKQFGFKSKGGHEEGSPEYRKELVQWLGRNAKPHPTEDAIAIGPDNVHNKADKEKNIKKGKPPPDTIPDVVLGKDEMRTAGTAKKCHGYNGDALSTCLEGKADGK